MCYLKIAVNVEFHWQYKIEFWRSEADTCVSFIFPLANMELSISDSQGWQITLKKNTKIIYVYIILVFF